jgi:hypothetical protein
MTELVEVVGGAGVGAVPLREDRAEFAGDREEAGRNC